MRRELTSGKDSNKDSSQGSRPKLLSLMLTDGVRHVDEEGFEDDRSRMLLENFNDAPASFKRGMWPCLDRQGRFVHDGNGTLIRLRMVLEGQREKIV